MKKLLSLFLLALLCVSGFAQSVTLTFTGRDANNHFIPMNCVVITNHTKDWQETIYYPDTILVMSSTGVEDYGKKDNFSLSQNFPNPFDGTTDVSLTVVESGDVLIEISDVNGRIVKTQNFASLQTGNHRFRIQVSSAGIYFLTARGGNDQASIKMVNTGNAGSNAVYYVGEGNRQPITIEFNNAKGQSQHPFTPGDQMKYVGYAVINGKMVESQNVQQTQNGSEDFILQFVEPVDGQPCPNAVTLTDVDGNVYNTVQIGNQCWMKENLRTTSYADNTFIPKGTALSNDIAYRSCPNNNSGNVATYGYLYNWKAVMGNDSSSNNNPSRVQGVCPNGWHVPSSAEWAQLTDYVSSQSQYVCGSDNSYIAKALASTTGWNDSDETCCVGTNPSSNNATGFSAVPAGSYLGFYFSFGRRAEFWSSTLYNVSNAYTSVLNSANACVSESINERRGGSSVRCLKDDGRPVVSTIDVTDITSNSATCGGSVTDDGGLNVTDRGICWSTSQYPTISDSHTTDGTGIGSYTSNLTGLTVGVTYYVRAYATNSIGTAYGEPRFFGVPNPNDGQPCPNAATLTDVDGNVYNTVQLGNQCWMAENLRATKYADSTSISLGSDTSSSTAYRYYPNNDTNNVDTYGYLYNWKAVLQNSSPSISNPSGVQGICPNGWHVPSIAEWMQLSDYVSSQSQYVCETRYVAKSLASATGWNSSTETCAVGNNPSINNATSFSAVPAGIYESVCDSFGEFAYFWSATQNDASSPSSFYLYSNSASEWSNTSSKSSGFSVRCVRD